MAADAPTTVLIVDDEPLAVQRLTTLCAAIPGLVVIGSAANGTAGLTAIRALRPDFVLLDIAMPDITGLEVARTLDDMPAPPAIVFCTAYGDHAIDAFEVAATDYLLKPVTPERLERAVDRVRERRRLHGGTTRPADRLTELWVPHRSEMIRLDVGTIDRFQAERDYVRVHSSGRSYLVQQTMQAFEQRLDPARFIRLHRSAIVRTDAIARLRRDGLGIWTAIMTDGNEQRISRRFIAAVRQVAALCVIHAKPSDAAREFSPSHKEVDHLAIALRVHLVEMPAPVAKP